MRIQRQASSILMMAVIGLIMNSLANAETYSYDGAGRLVGVVYEEGSELTFNMDANGNLLALSSVGAVFSLTIALGNRTISDTNGAAGESVNFSATATPNDSGNLLAATEWLVSGVVVGTGLTPSITLPDGVTIVTFKATSNSGASTAATVTITVQAPTGDQAWPTLYSGVTPNQALGLPFNNISAVNPQDGQIYSCLRILANGLPSSLEGEGRYDISFQLVSAEQGILAVTRARPFNASGALNEKGELPDCSGEIDLTTGVYQDFIQVGPDVYRVKFELFDGASLSLRLLELTAVTSSP